MLRRKNRKLLRKSLKLMRRRKGMQTRRKEEQQGRGEKVRAEEETEGDLDWKRSFSCENLRIIYILNFSLSCSHNRNNLKHYTEQKLILSGSLCRGL
jgi:hypothetical protein